MEYYDLPPDELAAIQERAAERGGVEQFLDLPPDDRAAAYQSANGGDQ